jgi:hypothetical protein
MYPVFCLQKYTDVNIENFKFIKDFHTIIHILILSILSRFILFFVFTIYLIISVL